MTAKQKSLVIGAIIGAMLGALGGYLFGRGAEAARERGSGVLSLKSVPAGEVVRLFIAVMAVLRGIAELGERL